MKITIESTQEIAHCNGLPVRVWTGTAEHGTAVAAFVTGLATGGDLDARDVAAMAADLVELPTRHGVDGGPLHVAAPRVCTVCNLRGETRVATHVASSARGLQWFECGEHGPAGLPRGEGLDDDTVDGDGPVVRLERLDEWSARHGLGAPGATATQVERLRTIIAGAFGVGMLGTVDELLGSLDRELNRQSMQIVGLRAVAESAADAYPTWLTKDFVALYRVAHATLDVKTLDTFGGACNETRLARDALRATLERLRVAFDALESERRPESPAPVGAATAAVDLHADLPTSLADCDPAPATLVGRLLDLPEVSGPGVDARVGGAFLAHAYRGAIMGRHAVEAHPGEVAAVARMAAPIDEPARSAWLRGFRLAADGDGPTLDGEEQRRLS